MRILVVEDDPTSRNMLTAVLRKAGHDAITTANGAEAWEELQKADAPKLIILDWIMPEMDGLELLRRILTLQTDRPPYILMLTAKGDKADIIAGLDAGANDYLSKPFDTGELRARIEVGRRMLEMQDDLAARIEDLRHLLGEIKTLRGILPICASCRKIRDDQGYWSQVEVYIRDHTDVEFSHSICPECMQKLYPREYEQLHGDHEKKES